MNDDLQHLKLLSIFHYVVAGITGLVGCFPVIHLAIGIALLTGHVPARPEQRAEEAIFGSIFTAVAGVAIITMWSFAVVLLCSARFLRERRRHTFCLIVAGFECLLMPYGTVLGVFTILVLMRPSVRQLFGVDRGTAT